MKYLKSLIVFAITIYLTMPNELYATGNLKNPSKEIWLKFNGINYCEPGFCAEYIPHDALRNALNFYKKNQNLINNSDFIGIIDFSLHSTKKRFFILNLSTGSVESILVTHGKKSETELGVAGNFSNVLGSEMSSIGFYLTDDRPYVGKHGISIRLDGISKSNNNARIRNIVLHGADYATQWFAYQKGRLGLSQGCPAVAPDKIEGVIKKLKGQGLLYIHIDSSNKSI